ncbi:hypothetical protein QYE76_018743 [Lolium multiflorum]|uniref:DUF4283 domain-containing protein n=1 Tax=Lolium multiflorum TaxID=4521 RepID=A0AAD8VAM2_LOLMU|nr:hypothetical protein QYE76_018743 [Lolium multiflorum]
MASSSGAGGSGTDQEPDLAIDDLLQHLDLREDELDDVVIAAEEVKEYQKDSRWMAIGKVHTSRNFSAEALFGKMKAVWNLSREPICREAGENLFVFTMHCLGDWKKVVHQGPWTFRGWAVMIQDYDGKEDPVKISFDGLHVWAQIHGIPELYRKVHIVDDLARRIGKVREVQMTPKLFYEGNYVRIRVLVNVGKPLTRVVSLNVEGEGKKLLLVKYEKVPFFCKHCGLMGHNHEECGDGVWTARQLQFGDFMLAVRRANPPTMEPRYVAPRGRGRGSGRGGQTAPRKRSSQDASLDDEDALKDSASSPVKPVPMETVDNGVPGACRTLALVDDNSEKEPAENDLNTSGSSGVVPPPPPPYTDPRDRSKQRKTNATSNDLATSAASLEEDRRAQ